MRPKLTGPDVAEIRRLAAEGVAIREIARRFARDPSHIMRVVRGDLHRDVPAGDPPSVGEARAAVVAAMDRLVEAVRADERARVRREDDDGQ
jgi:IS30 family transposase